MLLPTSDIILVRYCLVSVYRFYNFTKQWRIKFMSARGTIFTWTYKIPCSNQINSKMNKYIPVKKALQIKKNLLKNIPVFDSIATLHPKGVQCTLHSVCTAYEKKWYKSIIPISLINYVKRAKIADSWINLVQFHIYLAW